MITQKPWSKMLWSKMLLGIVALAFVSTACDKDDDDPPSNTYNLSGNATGAQEVPAVTTSGAGTISGTYNTETNAISFTITWTGLNAVVNNMHFHGPALAGVSAGVAVGITGWTGATAGSISGTGTLTEAHEADLLAGRWYYNIHTTAHGGGEIRGQITATRQ